MKLNQPKVVTWWIAVILGALGVLAKFVSIPFITDFSFWFVVAGLALLALATVIKDL